MSTFLYAPGIKVYINVEPRPGKKETIDVSEDLVSGNLVRRSDGVSTFSFSLSNTRRKYDSVFKPNDRIIVMMKRLAWVRVFTGYLDKVPLVTAWPKTVDLEASCSLKRLQHWYWDPGLPQTFNLVSEALSAARGDSDAGIAETSVRILEEVVGWPREKIHIGAIPENWFDFAKLVASDVGARIEESDALAEQYYSLLGGGGTVGGSFGGVNGPADPSALPPGSYAGSENLDEEQCRIAVTIYNAGVKAGCNAKAITALLAVGYAESRYTNLKHGDLARNDTVGVFQQGPEVGGTFEQRTTPSWAAAKAAEEMRQIQDTNRVRRHSRVLGEGTLAGRPRTFAEAPIEDIAWVLQGYDYTNHYGFDIVGKYQRSYNKIGQMIFRVISESTSGLSRNIRGRDRDNSGGVSRRILGRNRTLAPGTHATGMDVVSKGLELEKYYKDKHGVPLPYSQSLRNAPNTPIEKVTYHDCSSFTRWAVWQATGGKVDIGVWTVPQEKSGRKVSLKEALSIRGALLFRGPQGGTEHVAISLGDGNRTVETGWNTPHSSRLNVKEGRWNNPGNEWGLLIDGIDYTADGGGVGVGDIDSPGFGEEGATAILQYRDQEWYSEQDDIDRIFGNSNWIPQIDEQAMASSMVFTGIRALLNDEPLLPYIKNLMHSTLRSFCSAPNGDFMAWFPDYYGIWGTAAKMRIETIELQDFQVDWKDDFFVTHQYTQAAAFNFLNVQTGEGSPGTPLPAATTIGVASIDIPSILYSVLGVEVDRDQARAFAKWVYQRFGARPHFHQLPGMVDKRGEFFSALHLFMRQWAYQYSANVPITFMPELWPGMLIQIPAFDFQAYVVSVSHSFKFGPNGHFSTAVNIAAPARMPKDSGDRTHLMGLPVAGGLPFGGQTINREDQ